MPPHQFAPVIGTPAWIRPCQLTGFPPQGEKPVPSKRGVPTCQRGLTVLDSLKVAYRKDPALHGVHALEVVLYQSIWAIGSYRIAHALWKAHVPFAPRLISQVARLCTGIEIHPGATIGSGFFIDHGMGVVIGETAEVGDEVTLYHGVTLGGTSLHKGKRHPTLEDRVVVGAGAKVLGAITIGADSRIGANAVVVKSVAPNSVVVGVPGQPVLRSRSHMPGDSPDLEHSVLPDMIGASVISLMSRVDALEQVITGREPVAYGPHVPHNGSWHGEDFSI